MNTLRPSATHDTPILEFDPDPDAIIMPGSAFRNRSGAQAELPDCCVLCFFNDVLGQLQAEGRAEPISTLGSELGPNPIYRIVHAGQALALVHPGVGAPLAATFLEELIALGCTRFIACGGAGALDRELAVGHVIVPTAAVRDEGTSYHYLPAGREVEPSPAALAAIEAILRARGIDYRSAKTWTTDAPYRETRAKVARRREEGCATVEMEAAALFAVAQMRGVDFGQLLYAGDDVSGHGDWDHRGWDEHTIREELVWLAAECCLAIERQQR